MKQLIKTNKFNNYIIIEGSYKIVKISHIWLMHGRIWENQ